MAKNNQPPVAVGEQKAVAVRERFIALSPVEVELVRTALSENQQSKAVADGALAQRLAPIRAQHNVAEGVTVDFRPTKDQKSMVMTVYEPKKK